LLRRMTGGTAVLNDNVLSYTVAVTNNESRFTGTIAESYRAVSLALVMGLNLLGLKDAEVKELDTAPGVSSRVKPSPVCFEIPSHYEITVDGKKLVGSSQMRIRGGILQHGTLYLDGDIGEISCYLSSHPDPYRIRSKTITLREAIGHSETYAEVAQAFVHGFSAALNLKLANGVLQSFEQIQVGRLIKEKYANPAWTHRL
jgi:lipoate-protein ligase A